MLDIQYKFPWGSDSIERIYNHGKGPMEQYLTWMESGLVEVWDDVADKMQEKKDDASQKNLKDLLKVRVKRDLMATCSMCLWLHAP